MTHIAVTSEHPSAVEADALVVAVHAGPQGPRAADGRQTLHRETADWLTVQLRSLGATGRPGEVTKLLSGSGIAARVVIAVGVAVPVDVSAGAPGAWRQVGVDIVRASRGFGSVALAVPVTSREEVAALVEGALLGSYSFDQYRTTAREDPHDGCEDFTVSVDDDLLLEATRAASDSEVVARAVTWARDLGNMPGGFLTPERFVEKVAVLAQRDGLELSVLREDELGVGGYGGLLGVGGGSVNPPRLLKATWAPESATEHLSIVGKGITFDSGGLSLKDPIPMEDMKIDMAGAASAVAAVAAVAELGLPVKVTAWAALAENMPSPEAVRPGDVLTMYGGRTVEVLNTDAEGRLVLADALVVAAEDEPSMLVDIATLTGAVQAALGRRTAAVMGNDQEAIDVVMKAAAQAGEGLWPMPMPTELRTTLDSPIADMKNKGDREGGMLVAAHFLNEFVPDGIPWAHLDIGGTAFNDKAVFVDVPMGATGYGVRTLISLAGLLASKAE